MKELVNIDKNKLLSNGWVLLPELRLTDQENNEIINEASTLKDVKVYEESTPLHNKLYHFRNLDTILKPKLIEIAKDMGYAVNKNDVYCITRMVKSSNPKEMYKAHFDSHLFTLVTPIKIPSSKGSSENGELIIYPRIRNEPKSELQNFTQKLFYKYFANKKGIKKINSKNAYKEFNFKDRVPLLFLGRQTLHYNKPFDSDEYRITLLTHFFDPSSKYGIGNILRKIRNR